MVRLDFLQLLIIAEEVLPLDPHDETPELLQGLTVVLVLAVDEVLISEALLLKCVV